MIPSAARTNTAAAARAGARTALVTRSHNTSPDVVPPNSPKAAPGLTALYSLAIFLMSFTLMPVAFAMIAGWSSFFPQRDGYFLDAEGRAVLDAPAPLARFGAVLRLLIGSMVIIGCGAGAVRATAWFDSRGFGDPRAVLSRLAFAVSAAAAVRLVPVESHVLRNLVHGGLGIVLIAIVSMWILRDRGRLLGTMLACWALIFLLVVPVARLIAWSIPIF